MGEAAAASGPDFSAGIALGEIAEGQTISGRAGDEPVLLSRFDGELYAVSGGCTHYGAPLGEGLTRKATVRCPWHHACFDLKTGAALRAPALDPLDRWRVEIDGERAIVREKAEAQGKGDKAPQTDVRKIVIIGGGAAGLACANELRRLGYAREITILSADRDSPCDRPNLSKDYLAGEAPEEWLFLRSEDWYADNRVDLRLSTDVTKIDASGRTVLCSSGEEFEFDKLLIATGSEPNRLETPGFHGRNVFTLRSVADARAIAARAEAGSRVVVIGGSFIALEAAAALRHRNVDVDVVSPEHVPFERVFGTELGKSLQGRHERNGVRFHFGCVATDFHEATVRLSNGETLEADFVLVGIGVRPRVDLARSAGAEVDNGVLVDEHLETAVPGVFAAGDIAAYPDPIGGERVRIEHWVVAERQGEVAAANMLGGKRRFDSAPFFWTEQFGLTVRYVGHASKWDRTEVAGEIGSDSFAVRYFCEGRHCATATVGRDRENLEDELKLESRAR